MVNFEIKQALPFGLVRRAPQINGEPTKADIGLLARVPLFGNATVESRQAAISGLTAA